MNELTQTENGLSLQNVRAIKEAAEDFTNVTPEEITELIRNYAKQKRQSAFNTKFELSGIDYEAEKETFLESCRSEATRTAYENTINIFEAYTNRIKSHVFEITPRQADNFIYSISAGRSAAYTRLIVSGLSSFYTFLERRHEAIKNPFRGTKARPKKINVNDLIFPTPAEVEIILQNITDPILNTIIYIMAESGIRIGAFSNLTIKDGKYRTQSKGKEYKGRFSAEILERIKKNGLPLYRPFEDYFISLCGPAATERQKTETLKNKVFYELRKLYRAGTIKAPYSAHDFRHYYAVTEYRKDKDIYRVSKLLNHSGIQITEVYLKGLSEIE